MTPTNLSPAESSVMGQKYAFATASLVLGIACYVNILGMEKALLAILFAWMALKNNPAPVLTERRGWAKTGIVMGSIVLVLIPALLLTHLDRVQMVVDALKKLQDAK